MLITLLRIKRNENMKYLGMILIAFGLVDFVGSYLDFDLWTGFLGITLPDLLWQFSAYIECIVGYFLFNFGSKTNAVEDNESADKSSS